MLNMTKLVLSIGFALSIAFSATAASDRGRSAGGYRQTIGAAPDYSDRCPASGGPTCSGRCLQSGPPCKTEPDGW